jgi:hypothetical protein
MDWDRLRLPGDGRLRRRVAGADVEALFDRYGSRFSEWVERGGDAPAVTVDHVEPLIVGYLDRAAAAGRRWGTVAGTLAGLAGGALIIAVAALVAVLP